MNVVFTKQFEKDIRKILDKGLAHKVEEAILEIKRANNLIEIHNLKKLAGYKNCYRIRIGEYRLGLFVNKNIVEISRFLNRKEIYRYFP
jgi:mRNA interferase RelE/StbE